MPDDKISSQLFKVGDGSPSVADERFLREELQLALRNHALPLEGLRYDITPTGMHYLLVHYDVPAVDPAGWRLEVSGLVRRPLKLSVSDIRSRPRVSRAVTMECAGNGRAAMAPRAVSQPWLLEAVGTAEWTGTPLLEVLDDAGIEPGAVEALFTGIDRGVEGEEVQSYQRSLTLEEARRDEVLLAYEMNGAPLEPQHGFPLRLLVPGWYGMASVKWLSSIQLIDHSFDGYQMSRAYRYSKSIDDVGEPVTTIRVRSLMIPPGIPDFKSRARLVEAGRHTVRGRAWAGMAAVARVEFSADGGRSWSNARLGKQLSRFAWREWSCEWDAVPGERVLCVRATDDRENSQPLEPFWNFKGMGNNVVQRVPVLVRHA